MKTLLRIRFLLYGLCAFVTAAPLFGANCESLASLKLPDSTITLAQTVAAGAFALPAEGNAQGGAAISFKELPAFCRVTATLRPSSDSDIKIEVWLPIDGWNGKFQAIGNGGWAGSIAYGSPAAFSTAPSLSGALEKGYATAATDTGHAGNGGDASFALGHPEKVTDFGYRAVHEMTLKAKAIIEAFYGRPAQLSYWNGCSTGGRQGLKEAQRYPNDYDGIITGAPANYWSHLMVSGLWVAAATLKDPASFIPPSKYPVIHEAVLKACDAVDGLKDGLIDDPRRCHFDPKVLLCSGADEASCLTAPQVEAANKIYAAVTNPRTGAEIFPGLEPGSELGWTAMAGGKEPFAISTGEFRYLVYRDPNWDWHSFDFDKGVDATEKADENIITAIDPNLQPFFSHGGKLLMYHGWTDQLISPENSINYYSSVVEKTGGVSKTSDSVRLFMVPGMNHCNGGEGPSAFDKVAAMEQWRERDAAPRQMIASKISNGSVARSRPLCPYPQVAHYKGSGSIDEAANFVCQAP